MKLTYVWYDDWEGIYKDDDLLFQGHSVDIIDLLEFLSNEYGFEFQCWPSPLKRGESYLANLWMLGRGKD